MPKSPNAIRVAVIDTADPAAPSSMWRYADLIMAAMAEVGDIDGTRCHVNVPGQGGGGVSALLPGSVKKLLHYRGMKAATSRLRADDFNLYHVIDGSLAFVAEGLPADKTVITSHDIIPWLQAQGEFAVPAPGFAARAVIARSLRQMGRVGHVMCDSESTQRDLARATGGATHSEVVPLALEPAFFQHADRKPKADGREHRILHIGNNGFYKNRPAVLKIFAMIRDSLPEGHSIRLTMIGPPPTPELIQTCEAEGISDLVDFRVDCSDEEILSHYLESDLLIFPSIYEGFGWPPLEAMAAGCLVVASDAGSLPEVTGPSPTAAHDDFAAMAGECVRLLTDPDAAAALRAQSIEFVERFQVRDFATRLAAVYRKASIAAFAG